MWKRLTSVVAGALAAGCTFALDSDREQCSVDRDCSQRGAAFAGARCVASLCQKAAIPPPDPMWGCLESPIVPDSSEPGPFRVTLHLQDVVSGAVVVGARAQLCRKLDVSCESPEGEPVLSDESGNVEFQVTRGFSGYVAIAHETVLSGLYFFNPPVTTDREITSVQMITPTIADLLTKSVDSPLQPDRGLILLNVVDCQAAPAEGVVYRSDETDASSVVFYSVDGLPSTTALATDVSGYGGLVNVVPGTVAVTGELPDGRPMGTISLLVNARSITYSRLVPDGG